MLSDNMARYSARTKISTVGGTGRGVVKNFILSTVAVLFLAVPCSAVVMTDTFDTLDRQFWDTHEYLAGLAADPVAGTGSVLRLSQSAVLSHAFNQSMYGSVSFDIFCPAQEPHHDVSIWAGPESLYARPISFYDISQRYIYDAGYTTRGGACETIDPVLLDMTIWHTYLMVFDETATSAYIDGLLIGRSTYGGGFDTLRVSANIHGAQGYIDNFRYSSTMDHPSPVPEPSSLILLCLGFTGLIGRIVKRSSGGGVLRHAFVK